MTHSNNSSIASVGNVKPATQISDIQNNLKIPPERDFSKLYYSLLFIIQSSSASPFHRVIGFRIPSAICYLANSSKITGST